MKRMRLLLAFVAMLGVQNAFADTQPVNLKVNGLVAPLGIDSKNPTFSWQTKSDERGFRQSAYEISVKAMDGEEVWNSGKVESALQNQISYAGSPFRSCTSYSWNVTVYDKKGNASETGKGSFETAFLDANEWKAQWIQPSKTSNAKVEISGKADVCLGSGSYTLDVVAKSATGIQQASVENGIKNSAIYDLQGRRVYHVYATSKGIYIMNKKKVYF